MIEVLGWVAATLGMMTSVPQLVRILRSGTSAGVSMVLWQLVAGATGAWAVHGFLSESPQMQGPNIFLSLCSAAIVVFVARDRKLPVLRQFVMPLAVMLVLSGINVWLGAVVFGIAVVGPQLVGQISQLKELIVAPTVEGVSVLFLVLTLVQQILWFGFGMFKPDWALIIVAGTMTLSCIANLAVFLVRRARAANPTAVVAAR
ncbi:MAG: hypothetical protein Q4G35_07960 [Propionibacteriaceae bacterium]|nr:hypothetical protein [Propionibacteriaceae bacterium]